MSDLPHFLVNYFGLLKNQGFGKNDDERLIFVINLAVKSLENRAILVNFDVTLTDDQMRRSGHPRNPVIITPINDKSLSFFTNRKELERLINEANPVTMRSIFTRAGGKFYVDQPTTIELLQIGAIAQDVGAGDIVKPVNLKGDLITPSQFKDSRVKGFA